MKKQLKLLLLVALLASYCLPSFGQASTEGKEFWATLTIGDNNENKKEFKPYIAISSKKACKVIITNPRTGYRKEKDVLANDWTTIKDIPLTEWYPSTDTDNSHDPNYSENPYDNGLLIQSDEDISVYVANRMKYSFDASNILPVTALGSEYITQDFPPSEQRSVFAILATEDDTKIDITPTAQTVKGKTGTFQITLQRGETYQVMSNSETESLSGSHIFAHDGKKIAVFLGCVRTRIPADKAARDLLYEQAFPLDLWGTTFVVSRSKDRNADRVRITAAYNDTEVSIDGVSVTGRPLKAGETFEFEMSDGTVYASSGSRTKAPAYVCKNEAAFIEATCPCAVFLYATGQDYDKPTSGLGDPYMVWISPLEQMASEITFGACPTKQTQIHYANIITKKEDVNSLQLLAHEENFKNIISPNDFTPVPGKSDYCYALIKLGTAADEDAKLTFTLKGGRFVAHIYGHGDQESYAYSAGSSTLKNSMQIDGFPLDADRTKNKTFCVNKVLEFTPYAEGNYVVTQMRIDFGDGVILDTIVPDPQSQITNISVLHKYTSPSWYDITANYGGYKKCPQGAYIDIHHEIIKTCMDLQIPESQQVCNGEDLEIPFSYPIGGKHGKAYLCKVIHDPSAESGYHLDTLRDQDVDIKGDVVRVDGRNVDTLTLPISTWDPGKYTVCILMEDSNCTVKNEAGEEFPTLVQSNALYITVKYPADIIAFKFNNVLAVYQNKGYEFEAYQWYQNDAKIDPQKNPELWAKALEALAERNRMMAKNMA